MVAVSLARICLQSALGLMLPAQWDVTCDPADCRCEQGCGQGALNNDVNLLQAPA